jgi:hypothetical protein
VFHALGTCYSLATLIPHLHPYRALLGRFAHFALHYSALRTPPQPVCFVYRERSTLTMPPNAVISVAPSPTGKLFATGSGDLRARIWKYVCFLLCGLSALPHPVLISFMLVIIIAHVLLYLIISYLPEVGTPGICLRIALRRMRNCPSPLLHVRTCSMRSVDIDIATSYVEIRGDGDVCPQLASYTQLSRYLR